MATDTLLRNRKLCRYYKGTQIKALKLLNARDFVMINGIWEPTRDGLLKILLTSLSLSYTWTISKNVVNGGLHFIRAETRALKRAIETLFGSVVYYYVVNYLR